MPASTSATPIQRSARHFRRFAYVAAVLAMLCVGSEILLALSPIWHGGDQAAALRNGLGQVVLAVPVLCLVLECKPGDLLDYEPDPADMNDPAPCRCAAARAGSRTSRSGRPGPWPASSAAPA